MNTHHNGGKSLPKAFRKAYATFVSMDLAPWFCCGTAGSALTMDSPVSVLTVISCFSPDSPPPLNTPSCSPPQCLSLAVPPQALSSVFCHVPLRFILAYLNFLLCCSVGVCERRLGVCVCAWWGGVLLFCISMCCSSKRQACAGCLLCNLDV